MANENTQDKSDHAVGQDKHDKPKTVTIQIDRVNWIVPKTKLTAAELRAVPKPPIGPDRDLYQIKPNGDDDLIKDTESVEMKEGLRFFTAPRQINPGAA